MYGVYRFLNEDGSMSEKVHLKDSDFYTEHMECDKCKSHAMFVWDCTTGEYSEFCECCGYHHYFTFDIEELEDCFLVTKQNKYLRDFAYGFYINVDLLSISIHNEKTLNEPISDKDIVDFLEFNKEGNLSLAIQDSKNHKIKIIEGLYKGLIINMSNSEWEYEIDDCNNFCVEFINVIETLNGKVNPKTNDSKTDFKIDSNDDTDNGDMPF